MIFSFSQILQACGEVQLSHSYIHLLRKMASSNRVSQWLNYGLWSLILHHNPQLINAYIAKEDLKKNYRQPQVGLHRIRAYSKSIERMETLEITQIEIEKTTNDTIKFTITAESTKEAKQAKKYIQGAFCHVFSLNRKSVIGYEVLRMNKNSF